MLDKIGNFKDLLEIALICFPFVVGIYKLLKRLYKNFSLIEKISEELRPNGGGSLYDTIRKIESEILVAKSRTYVLLSTFPDGVYECDTNGECIWSNKAFQDLFGLSLEETLGHGWLKSVSDIDRIKVWDYWTECLRKNIPYNNTYIVKNKVTNRTFLCETCATPNMDSKGKILGYFGIIKVVKEITNE